MTREEIFVRLKTRTFGRNIHIFETLDSTNTYARTVAAESPEGTVILAEYQSGGRGRLGRKWHSSAGKNLTFSLLIRPEISQKYAGLVSLYAGLCVANAVERIAHISAKCKWPNDVLVDGLKISGILCEAIFAQEGNITVIIGIGLNVDETEFPADVRTSATSIASQGARSVDRVDLLCGILEELEALYPMLTDDRRSELTSAWSLRSSTLGKTIDVSSGGRVTRGTARAIAEDGSLILENEEGTHNIFAGDTSIV